MKELVVFIMLFSFSIQVSLSLVFLYTWINRRSEPVNAYFSVIFFVCALYVLGEYYINSSSRIDTVILWQKIELIGPLCLTFLYPLAMRRFIGLKGNSFTTILAILTLPLAVILFSTDLIITRTPVFYSNFLLQGDDGRLYPLFVGIMFCGLLYGYIQLIIASRKQKVKYSFPIIIGSGVAIVTGLIDVFRDILNWPIQFGSFFTAGIIIFGLAMGYSLIQRFLDGYHRLDYDEKYIRQLHFKSKKEYLDLLQLISTTLDAKDRYTAGHSRRVGEYAEMLASKLALPDDDLRSLRTASLLHDIGKIGISEMILNKPDRLTPMEFEEIKKHPLIGVDILSNVSDFIKILAFILYHHERIDGKGYPHGLKGEQIPLISRVIAVADTYDALTSDRPYRPAFEKHSAIDIIQEVAGTQLDAFLVDEFLKIVK